MKNRMSLSNSAYAACFAAAGLVLIPNFISRWLDHSTVLLALFSTKLPEIMCLVRSPRFRSVVSFPLNSRTNGASLLVLKVLEIDSEMAFCSPREQPPVSMCFERIDSH